MLELPPRRMRTTPIPVDMAIAPRLPPPFATTPKPRLALRNGFRREDGVIEDTAINGEDAAFFHRALDLT